MRRTLTIRHVSGDRVVALLEMVSPANKDRPMSVEQFANKAEMALREGVHLVLLDLVPPGPHDPQVTAVISQGNRSQMLFQQRGKLIDGNGIQCGTSGEKLRKRLCGKPRLIGQLAVIDPAFKNSPSQLSAHGWLPHGRSTQVVFHLHSLSPQLGQIVLDLLPIRLERLSLGGHRGP